MASNRSPSPLSSRNFRNSESYSSTRKSFSGNPFARPTSLINPKTSNPNTPANTPTATDLTKRNSMTRKSVGGGSTFQDGKENRKDSLRSPAKTPSKNFMSPTISAASKFTPSPRMRILGEKNESHESKTVEQIVEPKEVVREVNLSSIDGDSDFVKIRAFCCSPMAADSGHNLPPYDPKKNFLSPRPQFLRYKPNPRIEFLLNKEGDDDYGEDDVTRLEESFNLDDDKSSDIEETEQENDKEAESGDDPGDSVHGSSGDLSESAVLEEKPDDSVNGSSGDLSDPVLEEKPVDSVNGSSGDLSEPVLEEKPVELKAEKVSKPRFFTGSKTVSFVFVLFLVACFSLSFTESPPIDLPIYEDVGFLEIYHGSLRFAASAKESFDDLVENFKQWSMDLVVYLSHLKSHFIPTQKIESLQFFNLTTSHIQEEFQFNRHIGTDYIQEIQNFKEETERMEEEDCEETDDESDEVVNEEPIFEQIESDVDEVQEESLNLGEGFVSKEPILEQIQSDVDEIQEKSLNLGEGFVSKEPLLEQIQSDLDKVQEKSLNLGEGFVSKEPINEQIQSVLDEVQEESLNLGEGFVSKSEMVEKDLEIESSFAGSNGGSITTICVAGFIMVAMAVSTVFYMNQKKSNLSKSAAALVTDDNMREESGSSESSSVQKGYKKKTNYKRESLASSASEFSVSDSFGSFTTFERIAIKHKDEVMLTPIRRSSRLLKNQVVA